jgi:hypothetical protein
MKLYHFAMGKRRVYDVDPSVSPEEIFEHTRGWPGTRLLRVK